MKKHCGQKNWRLVMPVKFWLRFWFFLSYLITTVRKFVQTKFGIQCRIRWTTTKIVVEWNSQISSVLLIHADLVLETDSVLVFCVSKCSVRAYICLIFYVCSFFDGISKRSVNYASRIAFTMRQKFLKFRFSKKATESDLVCIPLWFDVHH